MPIEKTKGEILRDQNDALVKMAEDIAVKRQILPPWQMTQAEAAAQKQWLEDTDTVEFKADPVGAVKRQRNRTTVDSMFNSAAADIMKLADEQDKLHQNGSTRLW
jgi:hypothetical protein